MTGSLQAAATGHSKQTQLASSTLLHSCTHWQTVMLDIDIDQVHFVSHCTVPFFGFLYLAWVNVTVCWCWLFIHVIHGNNKVSYVSEVSCLYASIERDHIAWNQKEQCKKAETCTLSHIHKAEIMHHSVFKHGYTYIYIYHFATM